MSVNNCIHFHIFFYWLWIFHILTLIINICTKKLTLHWIYFLLNFDRNFKTGQCLFLIKCAARTFHFTWFAVKKLPTWVLNDNVLFQSMQRMYSHLKFTQEMSRHTFWQYSIRSSNVWKICLNVDHTLLIFLHQKDQNLLKSFFPEWNYIIH